MASKKSYQLKADHSSFVTTVNAQGKQVSLAPDNDVYETSDPGEQDALDAAVADPTSGLKKAEKKDDK